jgi:predicted permease
MIMQRLRAFAAKLVRGPDAEFVRHDLEDLYLRDRARGMTVWRAHGRYARSLAGSALSVSGADLRWPRLRGGTMLQDLRFALRLFRTHPTAVGIAIGGLAVAIGVVTAVFSIVNATMLRPYGMDDPSSVVSVTDASHRTGYPYWSYARFLRMRDEATLSRVEASFGDQATFGTTAADDASGARQRVLFVSGGYLEMLGGRPLYGRSLAPADDTAAAQPVAVVSHHFWSSQLGADPSIVGTTVWLNGVPVTLVGVLQPEFTGPVEFDLRPPFWAPFAAVDDVLMNPPLAAAPGTSVQVVARLAPGVSMQAAQEQLAAIVRRTRPAAATHAADAPSPVRFYSAASAIDGPAEADVYTALACVFVIAGLVLALACANTANLLMASAVTRRREMGVRLALGASTRRLVRQLVHESLLLGLLAGGLGFVLAIWIVPLFAAIVAVPPDVDLAPDGRVLIFTVAVALLCGLGAGLSPARYGARGNVLVALQSSSGSRGQGAVPSRLRTSFVGFQAAVSMLLLVFAALLARTALVAIRGDIGFDADRLLVVSPRPQRAGLDQRTYLTQALAAVRALPSVERASIAESEPFGYGGIRRNRLAVDGRSFELRTFRTDGDFFATAGVRLLRGRSFTSDEVARHAPVAIVSDSVARAFFPGRDPIGESVSTVPVEGTRRQEPATIVGVVADALLARPESQDFGAIYRPLRPASEVGAYTGQGFPIPPSLIVRAASPAVAARAIDDALRRVDPAVRPTTSLVRDRLDRYLGGKRMLAWVTGPVALLALFLAALGVYGVTAFVVTQRAEEVSVRMAIGASAADVLRLLVKDSLRPVAIGVAIGLGVAIAASRVSASMLQLSGISPNDPLSIGGATATLLACALAAVIVPARRAARSDPAGVLRQA